jgi:hypothetical protein
VIEGKQTKAECYKRRRLSKTLRSLDGMRDFRISYMICIILIQVHETFSLEPLTTVALLNGGVRLVNNFKELPKLTCVRMIKIKEEVDVSPQKEEVDVSPFPECRVNDGIKVQAIKG